VDAPIAMIQIMPLTLSKRPATSFSGCTMLTRPYNLAPGAGEDFEEGDAVTLIFCTLSNKASGKEKRLSVAGVTMNADKPAADDDEPADADDEDSAAITLDIIQTTALAREGYITKTSNGVSLIAFYTPDAGFGFIQDVAAKIQLPGFEKFKFCAGLHTGIPTSVAPNKASGRADYLGPPVNASARLLSLGAEDTQFHNGTIAVAVSSSAWMGIDNDMRTKYLKVVGQFQLKGIGGEIEVFGFDPSA